MGPDNQPIPCPAGTHGPPGRTKLADESECVTCPSGFYCDGLGGLTEPTGPCAAGYYCGGGATTQTPDNSPIFLEDDLDGYFTGNAQCPKGHYCPEGSKKPEACPPGTFDNNLGDESVNQCQDVGPGKGSTDDFVRAGT